MSVRVHRGPEVIEVVLTDDLRHPRFSWPVSRVAIPVEFGRWDVNAGLVASYNGTPVPVQLSEVRGVGTESACATVHLLSDLPFGAKRTFRLERGRATGTAPLTELRVHSEDDETILDNGLLRVGLPTSARPSADAEVLRIGDPTRWLGRARLTSVGTPRSVHVRQVEYGAVFVEYAMDFRFDDDRRYQLTVRLTAHMEFVELDERIDGFGPEDDVALEFEWDAIGWTHRYCANRPDGPIEPGGSEYGDFAWEPVDSNLGPDGALPIELVPYHSWLSWWRLPAAAFWAEPRDVSLGVFVTDHERWDDGEWAVWGSSVTLAGRFTFDRGRLRWRFPLASGTRAFAVATYPHVQDIRTVTRAGVPLTHIDTLYRWNGWLSLDKVKDWTLDHVEPACGYPRFFDTAYHELPAGRRELLRDLIDRDAFTLNSIPDGGPRSNHGPTPVDSREVARLLVPLFDETAGGMPEAERRDIGAALQFLGHVFEDETLMPVRRMLAGHPNFLTDVLAVVAALPFLFPNHPDAHRMADHFERAVALNLKYHLRPDVPAWQAQGGRWTENLACYVWGPVDLLVHFGHLLRRFFDGRNRLARPETSALGYWLLNTLAAPMHRYGGVRTLPPQGAHAHGREPSRSLRVLGQELANYDPLLAEYLLWAAPPGTEEREPRRPGSYDTWSHLQAGDWFDNAGTDPELESTKFTGYGFVLRAAVGTPDEVTVYLQQLDAGPNYRWGRAARGGNGVVYYYAAGRRYSSNNVEDVGDLIRGDVERCTNFGVVKPGGYRELGPYRSVGMNELTEPLYDLGFAQFARVLAGRSAAPDYTARSVLLSGADYIVLFDQVRDGVHGRFSWFVDEDEAFPSIVQLVPGATPAPVPPEPNPEGRDNVDHPWRPTTGRYYDGTGNFLTVVSHLDHVEATAASYGCVVRARDREDLVFCAATPHQYVDGHGVTFEGTVGIVRRHAGNHYEAALFAGTQLGVPGFSAGTDGTLAISVVTGGELNGAVTALQPGTVVLRGPADAAGLRFYLDGQLLAGVPTDDGLKVLIPAGTHRWQWSAGPPTPGRCTVVRTENRSGGFTAVWTPVAGATGYRVELSSDGGRSWRNVSPDVRDPRCDVSGLVNGTKVHVRVTAVGERTDGPPSRPYPVYVTGDVPPAPDGLLLSRADGGILAGWGEVLGAHEYRLDRRISGETEFTCVATGVEREYLDKEAAGPAEYRVTAVNGNGESLPSPVRDTSPGGLVDWDPRPDEVFRRATQSYEMGYDEVDPWIEQEMPTLTYPDPERRHWTSWRR
ncbi:fibronectin type III domain-containing protein [Kribbella sp. NPDC000426]|uniref:fibronectin type III domain-containing protein n=1 Tax=Kribbella sp. NPDC000426 TaxID=3154255 RepID=UPI00331EFF6C